MPKNDAINSTNTAAIRSFKDAFMIIGDYGAKSDVTFAWRMFVNAL